MKKLLISVLLLSSVVSHASDCSLSFTNFLIPAPEVSKAFMEKNYVIITAGSEDEANFRVSTYISKTTDGDLVKQFYLGISVIPDVLVEEVLIEDSSDPMPSMIKAEADFIDSFPLCQ